MRGIVPAAGAGPTGVRYHAIGTLDGYREAIRMLRERKRRTRPSSRPSAGGP